MQYRNYEIDIPDRNCPFSYRYVHNNYGGPEDRRIGFGSSILDCKSAIDDAIDDAIHCDICDSTGIVHIGNRPYPNDPRSIEETFSEECEKCSQIRVNLVRELCSHVRDNQGFCHNCGIPICEETIRSEGLWKDGMVCDLSNE